MIDGQGVGLAWLGMTDHLLRTGALVRPIAAEVKTGRAFYLVAPKGMRHSPMAIDVRNRLLQEGTSIQRNWESSRRRT